MRILRKLYGLQNVSKSFYLGGKCNISRDLTVTADFENAVSFSNAIKKLTSKPDECLLVGEKALIAFKRTYNWEAEYETLRQKLLKLF